MTTHQNKLLVEETPVDRAQGIVVVTCDCGTHFEVRVLGGELDGWTKHLDRPHWTEAAALDFHRWMCRLVHQSARPFAA